MRNLGALVALTEGNEELMEALVIAHMASTIQERIPIPVVRFNIHTTSNAVSMFRFRFNVEDVLELHQSLQLPDVIYTKQRVPIYSLEALCIMLRRLSYPGRWLDMVASFGRSDGVLSSAFLEMITLVHKKIDSRMQFDECMIGQFKDECCLRVQDATGLFEHCLGFVDGTVRPICRPTYYQRQAYNGHKRVHALKFQSVVLANGLFVSLTGPMEGRRHDSALLRASGFGRAMRQKFPGYYVYGDPAYPLSDWIIRPYKGRRLTSDQQEFNRSMSSARVCVEWMFSDIITQWAFLDFKKNLKINLSPVGKFYIIAAFLTNCRSCVKGKNQASQAFKCSVPSLTTYLTSFSI